MPTPDPSASLTAFQSYAVARDAAAFGQVELLIFVVGLALALIAGLLGALVVAAIRRG